MKRSLLAGILLLNCVLVGPAQATTYKVTLAISQSLADVESTVTLSGAIAPIKKSVPISIQVKLNGKWLPTFLTSKTSATGKWKIVAKATALDAEVAYRAVAKVLKKSYISPAVTLAVQQRSQISELDPQTLIEQAGPGTRIAGIDISKWQHPNDRLIDFAKMYKTGVRFVMIKASDTRDLSDAQANKWVRVDAIAAKSAGLYTGFYHYATLPDSTDAAVIVKDAQTQAQKAIWRLASIGGYTTRDLSYALDLENNCVRTSSNGSCAKYASRNAVTLFAKTWLTTFAEKTGRKPILYSYSQFLENAMTRDPALAQFPLWIAHYSINPADPLAQPGKKVGGCYVHSWTSANCQSEWTIWQYSSCGIAGKYGVPGSRVDLNVFRGTSDSFLNLIKGTWTPEAADMMPVGETSTMQILSTQSSASNKPLIFSVNVTRPSGDPVVTGTVKFVVEQPALLPYKFTQTALRSTSGSWTLTVKNLAAGIWNGSVLFTDISGTHGDVATPVIISIAPGPTPSPTPQPTPSPKPVTTPKPVAPVDTCKNQIRN